MTDEKICPLSLINCESIFCVKDKCVFWNDSCLLKTFLQYKIKILGYELNDWKTDQKFNTEIEKRRDVYSFR